MKKIFLILLLFLLPLCLVPPTAAVYGDESPQSITSFAETLPNDVLYYPDSFSAGIIELADYGEISDESYSADYILTHVKDGSAFNETTATDIEIWFEVDTTDGFEGFSYAHYLNVDSGTDVDLAAYDFDQDFFVKIDEPVPSSYAWMNGTIYDPDYWNTTHIAFTMYELSGNADLYWDYGEITIHRMTLADSNHYAEGFNDVSDWTAHNLEGDDSFSSDGDVMTFVIDYTSSDADRLYDNSPTGLYEYIEIRYRYNDSGAPFMVIRDRTEDFPSGSNAHSYALIVSTTWKTLRIYYGFTTESFFFEAYAIGAYDNFEFYVEYLRAGPAGEMGLQHDGSTTEGLDADLVQLTVSTDGDKVTMTATAGAYGRTKLRPDTTTTQAMIDPDYYPFFEFSITENTAQWYMSVIWSDTSQDLLHDYAADTGIFRYNLEALSGGNVDIDYIYIAILYSGSYTTTFDYFKFYSIANFTVSDVDDETTDKYLYVDSGNLICSDTVDYIRLQYDPSISIANDIYAVWNANVSSGAEYFRFRDYGDGTYYDQGETSGLISSTIMGGFQLLFYGGLNLDAITFIDIRDWQEIGEVDFVIPVGWDPTFIFGYDAFFIFLGLILIPVSTMYLVRGGREEASADKVFYFLIMFMIGFGLLVGGIMP